MYEVLSRVNHPHDLKGLTLEELEILVCDIRQKIAEVVDKNGGHFGSNLGVVELTLALHRSFDFPNDRLVWDTSHQSYPHKLVTGRRDKFHSIRKYGGICGFSTKKESIFDLFDAGHAGTACGLALGVSIADRLRGRTADGGRPAKSIAVAGDTAIVSGMSFEALNHAGEINENLIVILNDNKMSIDYPVGAFAKYLNRFRTKPIYQDIKRDVQKAVSSIPLVGRRVEESLEKVHDALKHTVGPDLLFQELGFKCYGPIDGHDLNGLLELFEDLKHIQGPILVHLHTEKGHGYEPALSDPVKYHALKNFLEPDGKKNGTVPYKKEAKKSVGPKKNPTYSQVFKETMHEMARKDRRVVAITAGMSMGTGLSDFAREFPDRFFDVGIAEQHGAALASGLVHGGMRPVFAVYSTFCQRCFDQFVHDTCLQENAAVYCLDRAGLAGEDGWTHHGVLDISYMRCVPNCVLMAPRDGHELIRMLQWSIDQTKDVAAIRYPKATTPQLPVPDDPAIVPGKAEVLVEGEGVVLFAYGSMVGEAYKASLELENQGIRPTVVNARWAKPLDLSLLERLSRTHDTLITLEEHNLAGGFGSAVVEGLMDHDIRYTTVRRLGIEDRFVSFGSREQLMAECGIDVAGIVSTVCEFASPVGAREVRAEASEGAGRRLAGRAGDRLDLRV